MVYQTGRLRRNRPHSEMAKPTVLIGCQFAFQTLVGERNLGEMEDPGLTVEYDQKMKTTIKYIFHSNQH